MKEKTTYVITIDDFDERNGYIKVYETNGVSCDFIYDEWEIKNEFPETDNEDFNDTARWISKTIIEIKKMEYEDEFAHCDWSADYEKNQETGRYKFAAQITKITKENNND